MNFLACTGIFSEIFGIFFLKGFGVKHLPEYAPVDHVCLKFFDPDRSSKEIFVWKNLFWGNSWDFHNSFRIFGC